MPIKNISIITAKIQSAVSAILTCFTVSFLVIISIICFQPEPVSADILHVACDDQFPPFEYTENGKITGFAVEIVKSVFTQMDIQYKIESFPWKRAESMVLSGEVDALFSASYLDARADQCWYPLEHLFESIYVFFIRCENADFLGYEGFEDLKLKHIGVTLGYSYNELFWMFLKETGNYTEVLTDEQNLLMLSKGRCDYSIIERDVGMTLLKEMKLEDKIIFIPKPVIQKPYFMIFNKKRVEKDLVEKFSRQLDLFKNSEAYKEIYKQFFKK